MSVPKPHWFHEGKIMVSNAPTCGISKSGGLLPLFDEHGNKIMITDEDTGEETLAVNDVLLQDMVALRNGDGTKTLRFFDVDELSLNHAVPVYYDRRFYDTYLKALEDPFFSDFDSISIGELVNKKILFISKGHGSAPKDLGEGEVPYIKVSDLRAGLVNINPTNKIPLTLAQKMWRSDTSGLRAFDLISPERASKNIGDFCLLMPGQEQVLLTKEVIILRPGINAIFDSFYLLWAMSLKIVRDQWNRVVFMQTNREDVGKRYLEIEIPIANNAELASAVSNPFRQYFTTIAKERNKFIEFLSSSGLHHFPLNGATEE